MENKPKIELRNITHNRSLSQETPAYKAKLYVDDAHLADVSNHGHGGADRVEPAGGRGWDDIDALCKRIKATIPPTEHDVGGEKVTLPPSLELICHQLLAEHADSKALKRLLARKLVILQSNQLVAFSLPLPGGAREKIIAASKAKYPSASVLNDVPFERALALYRSAGQ